MERACTLENRQSPVKDFLLGILIVLYGMIFFTFEKGLSFLPSVLLLWSLIYVWRKNLPKIGAEERTLYLSFVFYFLVSMLAILVNGDGLSTLDEPVKFLLFLFIFFLLIRNSYRVEFLWAFIVLASITNFIHVLVLDGGHYEVFENYRRLASNVFEHPLYFGNVSLLFGFLSLSGLIWTVDKTQKHRWAWRVAFLLGFFSGLYLSILSGTRGGWIAIPFATYFILFYFSKSLGRQSILYTASALVVIFAIVAFVVLDSPGLVRLQLIFSDLSAYFIEGDSNTSLGARFEMWLFGFQQFLTQPILGVGIGNYIQSLNLAVEKGQVIPELLQFQQLHNQFLQELVLKGILGLVSLLSMFFVLIRFYSKRLNSQSATVRAVAVAGAVTCYLYLEFFLSISMFHLNRTTLTFLIIIALSYGWILNYERTKKLNSQSRSAL